MKVYFAAFALDATTRQLTRGREDVHLSTKAFDLLLLLIERRPAVLDKATIRRHLWPDTHVVDATLTNLIAEIRHALSDRPPDSQFVRTVHGIGYAFSGDARESEVEAPSSADRAGGPRFWLTWKGREIVLTQHDNVIGRDPACTVWIDAPGVSRRHARIRMAGDGAEASMLLEDLDSTNGVFLGGARVTRPEPLKTGDRIRLGEATLTFRAWKDAEAPTKRVRPRKP